MVCAATQTGADRSTKDFINSVAAARNGDKLTCGATIISGSDNVIIGGVTVGTAADDDVHAAWLPA